MFNDLSNIVTPLLAWYDDNARTLPWRENKDPYRIWVSEIMLQQTRVEAVKPYYERFLEELPDIQALAEAEEEKLLKLWEGLGYYSRARNLQKAARVICKQHNGVFPESYEEILKLSGIGPYTAGAIASIAFDLPEPAVDGNVLRVLARLQESDADINDLKRKKQATEELRAIYPETRCGDFTQSLMELGAVICLPNGAPLCTSCPLKSHCSAYSHGTQESFPIKSSKKARRKEKKTVLLLCMDDCIAIEKRPKKGLLAGLWQFPLLEGRMTEDQVSEWLTDQGFLVKSISPAGAHKHIFTHIEWEMQGFLIELAEKAMAAGAAAKFVWVTRQKLQDIYSLPTAFRTFMKQV